MDSLRFLTLDFQIIHLKIFCISGGCAECHTTNKPLLGHCLGLSKETVVNDVPVTSLDSSTAIITIINPFIVSQKTN